MTMASTKSGAALWSVLTSIPYVSARLYSCVHISSRAIRSLHPNSVYEASPHRPSIILTILSATWSTRKKTRPRATTHTSDPTPPPHPVDLPPLSPTSVDNPPTTTMDPTLNPPPSLPQTPTSLVPNPLNFKPTPDPSNTVSTKTHTVIQEHPLIVTSVWRSGC